jgi:hypothetical protein
MPAQYAVLVRVPCGQLRRVVPSFVLSTGRHGGDLQYSKHQA